jgi:prepilin-type N-terminal cleavage/methylation domain-containing protein
MKRVFQTRGGDGGARAPGRRAARAFTLLELLTVITIIGIVAAIALPNLHKFKPNVTAAAARRLMTEVGRARQLAISQRTTVYMVFVTSNFWSDPGYAALQPSEKLKAAALLDKQLIGYTFVSLRGVGDQPGRSVAHYWAPWRTLPEGCYIPPQKFSPFNSRLPVMSLYTNVPGTGTSNLAFQVYGFMYTNGIPFPSEFASATPPNYPPGYVTLPYIAFDYLGRLVDAQGNATHTNALIPLAQGNVSFARGPDKVALQSSPSVGEQPVGNSTNSFSLINIDWLTGRARMEHPEVQ